MPLPAPTIAKVVVTPGAKILQDQLHDLVTRLTLASDHIKNWNESGNTTGTGTGSADATQSHNTTHNTTVHAETTSRFISLVHEVLNALQKVEATLKSNLELRQALQNIHVPYDLLELMDYTNINPDLYTHGLVTEATQQLVGLQRRKNALHLLSTTIENRLNADDEQKHQQVANTDDTTVAVPLPSAQSNATILLADNTTNFANRNKRDFESTTAPDRSTDNLTAVSNASDDIHAKISVNEEPAYKRQRT